MAKGNLMQGMAHGAVGDVVFSRVNGQQVARVRNRNPYNPRTNAQLYQRAIMATVMQAYSAGSSIFDHSIQGRKTGSECMGVFMSENVKKLRAQIAYEINNNVLPDDQKGHCVWPGSTWPVPNEYLISRGTYDQKAFTPVVYSGLIRFMLPTPLENERICDYAKRAGLIPDDYYTFVIFIVGEDEQFEAPSAQGDSLGIGFDTRFGFARMHVRSNIAQITDVVDTFIGVFEIDETDFVSPTFPFQEIRSGISLESLDYQQNGVGAIGCIRSRKDQDLRSTSYMYCPSANEYGLNSFGLVSSYVLESWQTGAQSLGNSELILEGSHE